MKVLVVLNAASGAMLDRSLPGLQDEIRELFGAAGIQADVVACTGSEIAATVAAGVGAKVDAIVVGGGDGTIAAAAGQLIDSEVALGILPLGTANLLARDLALPLDLPAAIGAIAAGTARRIDVAEVNGRVFLNASMLGLLPRLALRREKHRGRMGILRWWEILVASIKAFVRYPRLKVAIDTGFGPRRIRVHSLFVTNDLYDLGIGTGGLRSRLDRGALGIYLARHSSPWTLLRLVGKLAFGSWQSDPEIDVIQAPRLAVVSRKKLMRVANDGEVMLIAPPLRYRIRRRALKVLAGPAEADPAAPSPP